MSNLSPEQKLSNHHFKNGPTGRRNTLKLLPTFAAILALPSCALPGPDNTLPPPGLNLTEAPNPYSALAKEINTLPTSYIKTELGKVVLGLYYSNPAPTSVNIQGHEVPLSTPILKQPTFNFDPETKLLVSGWLNVRRPLDYNPPEYKPVDSTQITYPLLNLLTPEELAAINSSRFIAPGLPAITVEFKEGVPLYSLLAPEIIISSADPNTLIGTTADHLNSLIHYVTVKEAAGLLLVHLHLEQLVSTMRLHNLPTTMAVTDSLGNSHNELEIITQLFSTASKECGRTVAALDVAANYLAMHAVSDEIRQAIQKDPLYIPLVEAAMSIPPGTSHDSLINTSYEWALQPASRQVPHNCSFNLIP